MTYNFETSPRQLQSNERLHHFFRAFSFHRDRQLISRGPNALDTLPNAMSGLLTDSVNLQNAESPKVSSFYTEQFLVTLFCNMRSNKNGGCVHDFLK